MRRCGSIVVCCLLTAASAFKFTSQRACTTCRTSFVQQTFPRVVSRAEPERRGIVVCRAEPERRGIDPVVGKAIFEKSGFFAAAVVLAIIFEKAQHFVT